METVVIAGGTGMVGRTLTKHLVSAGYKVIVLTRDLSKKNNTDSISFATWDVKNGIIDNSVIPKADYIINLAGANVMGQRWSKSYKKEIVESRTLSGQLITKALLNNAHHVKAFISSSAIGWYGKDLVNGYHFTESDKPDKTFLGETCRLWEESTSEAEKTTRVCRIRTGIVLGNEGGFLKELKLPLRLGIVPIPGNGRQITSWIHITDLCRIIEYAMKNNLAGSYNAVAPLPVTIKEITLKYGERMRGKFFIPVHAPSILLKLALGERAIEILKSTTVSSEKIKTTGFTFLYPSIDSALKELTKK